MTCCGKRLTPYRKLYPGYEEQTINGKRVLVYKEDLSWEEGYRCKKCGRGRVPVKTDYSKYAPHVPLTPEQQESYLENLRNEQHDLLTIN
jgi:hypothetical protein